jgi:hypothetical protein
MNGRLKKIRWVFFMNVTEMDGFRFFLHNDQSTVTSCRSLVE